MSGRWEPSTRRRRRNLLLLAGLAPSIVAVTVAFALLLMLFRQSAGVADTERGDHGSAREHFAANRWGGTVERWIAPYNEGVATFREEEYADALADFEMALLEVPPDRECLVVHNIAVTREQLGDLQVDDADQAMDQYRAGREVLADGSCLQPDVRAADGGLSSETRQLDAELVERIRTLLSEREQLDRDALSPEELRKLERLERQEERAERREQRAQGRDPEDGSGQGESDEEVYGW